VSGRRAFFAVFAVVSVGLTVWIGAQLSGFERDSGRSRHHATFADATNLQTGDPVRVSGVRVGKVVGVRVVAGQAAVDFELSAELALPVDSEVAVRSQNIIGIRELVVQPGTSSTILADGEEMEITSSAVDLGALINEIGPLLEAVSPDQLNTLVEALNQTLAGNRETIAGVTSDFTAVLDSLAGRSDTIAQLIADYGTLSGELAARDRQIQRLLDNLVLLTETFDASEATMVAALDELPAFAQHLDQLLDANATNLHTLLTDLAVLTGRVGSELDTLDAAVAGLPTSVASLFGVANLGELLVSNFVCTAETPPPCPHPATDGGPSLADVLEELMAP
jgi:phospholipid/cholesterol/gamma-HCH transport system substrate-binding protein